MERLPDYEDLRLEYEAEQERKLAKYPKCDICGEPITDDRFYEIDGDYYCIDCMEHNFIRWTDNYMR